jgi:hypothetical protein
MANPQPAPLAVPPRGLDARGAGLIAIGVIGAALRVFLVVATDGTDDVPIWQSHAGWTNQYGLVGYYGRSEVFNHPPFIGWLHAQLFVAARVLDIPFRILLRAPYALLDLGNALLLYHLFRGSRHRELIFAAYWLNPLAMIFSAYHGNTDIAVATAMLAAVTLAGKGRVAAAGVALGVGLWVKLPVLLASPALFFFFRGRRNRLLFASVFLGVGVTTYLPVLWEAPGLLYQRVIAYPGLHIHTPGGDPIWGIWNVFGRADALPVALRAVREFHADHNTLVSLLPVVLFAWLRRTEREPLALGSTVCGSLLLFHGLTTFWAFQYLAWLLPFLLFPGVWCLALATLVLGGYVYAVYATLCDSLLLLGKWDFNAHRVWPTSLVALRDAAVLFCLATGLAFLVAAVRRNWLRFRAPHATGVE